MMDEPENTAVNKTSGENFLDILNSMDEVIYVSDPHDYTLLFMNRAAVERWGDGTGRKCYSVLQGLDEPCPFCTNSRIMSGDPSSPCIWTHRNLVNGRWYKCTDRSIDWVGGRKVRFELAVDITERVEAEQALKESQERYRILVESSLDAIFLETLDGEVLDCNQAACSMLGYTRDELIGMRTRDLLPGDKLEMLPDILQELSDIGKSFVIGENLRKDGTRVPVESWTRLIDTAAGKRVVVYVRDITQRLRNETELQRSERRFRSFMDQLPAAVFLKDSKSRYVYINPYMRRVFGADDGWLGRSTQDCFPEESAVSLMLNDREALDSSYSIDVQRMKDTEGVERIFQTHKFRISGGGTEEAMIGGVALDITEKVTSENEKRDLEAQIQHTQKLESLGVLAGGIAHDFNNILMAILGYADLALLDTTPGSSARSSIEEIEKAARNAADLTKQMLAYSGKGKFELTKLDLNSVIREMTHLLEISISKKAVIRFDLRDNLPPIEADPSQIRQVIMNLITNASDAMEETSGVISITTSVMNCDAEYLKTAFLSDRAKAGRYVYMEVSDNGCGMDEETRRRLFDPFFTTKFTGRGLGLSAVLGIVRGHGGTVKVYSEPGRGSSFKILLPAAPGVADEESLQELCELDSDIHATILMVDDESSVRNVCLSMLERKGYRVLSAVDGRDALKVFREHHREIDCVLLDLTMPHMDGEETFREMRMIDPGAKVIISSGYNEQEVTQRFVGKHLAGFIQKPYRLNELHSKLQDVLKEGTGGRK